MSCESVGVDPANHFILKGKMVAVGSGAERKQRDYIVSRYGAYLIAMNGNPRLPQIAAAQTYFAVQTRRQEKADQYGEDIAKRIKLRGRVAEANIHLGAAAQEAGVQDYALFHNAGYRGLYGLDLRSIKARKGLAPKEELLDRAGRAELAANEFRITQTEAALKRGPARGQVNAEEIHKKVGAKVRSTIEELGGTMPEDSPAEPSIKKIEGHLKRGNSWSKRESPTNREAS
jgi:DNA-damage-inducible protein D